MTDRVICETCGEDTWSADYPCSNCETNPPVSNWATSFRFDRALRGMRLGKAMRRPGWDGRHVVIENRGNGAPILSLKPSRRGEKIDPYHPCSDDVLADDWEVVQ